MFCKSEGMLILMRVHRAPSMVDQIRAAGRPSTQTHHAASLPRSRRIGKHTRRSHGLAVLASAPTRGASAPKVNTLEWADTALQRFHIDACSSSPPQRVLGDQK